MKARCRARFALGAVLLAGLLAGCAVLSPPPVGNRAVPEPAKPVELKRYAGLWYEIARYDNSFERGCEGVTAEYSLLPDGLVRVVNTCREGSPDGPVSPSTAAPRSSRAAGTQAEGLLLRPVLRRRLLGARPRSRLRWSIVGEPSGRYLWLLARSPQPTPDSAPRWSGAPANSATIWPCSAQSNTDDPVTDDIALEDWEVTETFIRASGPGGQNVNKVSSAVQLRFDVRGSPSLPEAVKHRLERLAGSRLTSDGVLVLTAQRFRDQPRNREDALERLLALIRQATEVPRRRRPTRPTLASKVRRLDGKTRRAGVKAGRGRPASDD
jgi:ribosome-associated protein